VQIPFSVGDIIEGFNEICSFQNARMEYWVEMEIIAIQGATMKLLVVETTKEGYPFHNNLVVFTVDYTQRSASKFRHKYSNLLTGQ
jgi:hypothetical protein